MRKLIIDLNEYSTVLTGMPPDDFQSKIHRAQQVCRLADDCGLDADEDVYLIAALASYENSGANPGAFLQRAKQVLKWLTAKNPPGVPGSLEVLVNKTQELARLIFQGLFKDEGFILLVFDHGTAADKGHMSWIATCNRRESIRLLSDHLEVLRAEQEGKS